MAGRWPVILLPGIVTPVELAYGALLAELGEQVDARAKELEVYAGDGPPADYSLDVEVAGITRSADAAGFDTFHLVGYSGGGGACLAFSERHPERLRSLALLEPAWIGWQELTAEERDVWRGFEQVEHLPEDEVMAAFIPLELAPGVAPPAPSAGPAPEWMASRPAGIKAIGRAFRASDLDLDRLRRFERPVYYGLGALSNPDYYGKMAERLASVFSDYTLELFAERHHFDPPHRIEPARLAESLRALWRRAEASRRDG